MPLTTKYFQRHFSLIILVALFSITANGQSGSTSQQATGSQPRVNTNSQALDLGHLDGTNYVNDFFGLSLSIPSEWVVVDAQRRAELDEKARKMLTAPDQKQLARVENSIERSKTLLRITKLPIGQPNNAQFVLIAERVASPSIRTGLDVIEAMLKGMKGTNFTIERLGESRTETLSGTAFGVVDIKVGSPAGSYRQRVYTTVKGEYALELFFSYINEADLPAFAEIVKSVKVK